MLKRSATAGRFLFLFFVLIVCFYRQPMDQQIKRSLGLTEADIEFLHRVEIGMPITADVSRADILLCTQLGRETALVAFHASPNSISSLYRTNATGRTLSAAEQPLLFQALRSGSGGRRQREVLSNGAPVIQDVFPLHNDAGKLIGAMVVETNMIAHERQRRRNRHFRQAVVWMQEMCVRGELESASVLSGFGVYDGVYLVDQSRDILYMSGIAANLFRSAGITTQLGEQPLKKLEPLDEQIVEQAFETHRCQEIRYEADDGRVWVRRAIPLHMPPVNRRTYWLVLPWGGVPTAGDQPTADAVLVLLHNATEAVQKQRELNVKAAIIQEVHHRVKNNLQNIAAILRIQARRAQSEEARQHLTEAVNRVLSMSVIHEFLSQDEHRPINVRDVCQRIAAQVQQVSGNLEQEITIQVQGTNIRLPASQATPMAMVVNELLLNAVEHGLAGRPRGRILIQLDDLGDSVALTVEDDGHGLPPDFSLHQAGGSLGLHIVQTLVTDDLKGSFRMESIGAAGDSQAPGPLLSANEALPAADPQPAAPAVQGTRALVRFPKRPLHLG
jgi:two-component sensor histidine kinase